MVLCWILKKALISQRLNGILLYLKILNDKLKFKNIREFSDPNKKQPIVCATVAPFVADNAVEPFDLFFEFDYTV